MASDEEKMQKGSSFANKTPPTAAYVRWLLAGGDVTSPKSPLHYLGSGPGDAAPGDHKHDGRTSSYLFTPGTDVVTGNLAVLAGQREAIKKIITLLTRLGVTDSTTN